MDWVPRKLPAWQPSWPCHLEPGFQQWTLDGKHAVNEMYHSLFGASMPQLWVKAKTVLCLAFKHTHLALPSGDGAFRLWDQDHGRSLSEREAASAGSTGGSEGPLTFLRGGKEEQLCWARATKFT